MRFRDDTGAIKHICPSLKIYKENPYLNFYNVKKFSLDRMGGERQHFFNCEVQANISGGGWGGASIFIRVCQFPFPEWEECSGTTTTNPKRSFSQNIHFLILHGPGLQQIFPGICLCLPFWLMSSTLPSTTTGQFTLRNSYLTISVFFDFLSKHVSDILLLLPKVVSETFKSEIWPDLQTEKSACQFYEMYSDTTPLGQRINHITHRKGKQKRTSQNSTLHLLTIPQMPTRHPEAEISCACALSLDHREGNQKIWERSSILLPGNGKRETSSLLLWCKQI